MVAQLRNVRYGVSRTHISVFWSLEPPMSSRNLLLAAPPYPVEQALKSLGSNLRTARLRRNLSLEDVAAKIGAGPM